MPGIKIKLRAISDSIQSTGVYGKDGEYPVGHALTLPEGVPLIGSGYERHEVISKGTTAAHETATGATSGTDDVSGTAKDAGQVQDADLTATTGYTVAESESAGWWVITDKDGAQVGPKLRKADADAFSALKPDEQDEYAAQHVEAV